MKFGTWRTGLVCGVLLFAVLLLLALLPHLATAPAPGAQPTAGQVMGRLMSSLPTPVAVWMEFSDYITAGSLFFVLWRREAQIYALGPVFSHLLFFGLMPLIPIAKLTTGLASLSHWVFIVPLIVLLRAWRGIDLKTGYGVWACLAIGQLLVVLFFDVPDGMIFLYSLIA